MRIIGLAPRGVFSGFETSFFRALLSQGATMDSVAIEAPFFKLLCTALAVYPVKRVWGLRRDRFYYLSPTGFRLKSRAAAAALRREEDKHDLIYQVGSLWNPLLERPSPLPLILQVDYTTVLANRRNAEWKVENPRQLDFWLTEERRLYRNAAVILTTTENARRSIVEDYQVDPQHVVTVGAGVSPPYDRFDDEEQRTPDYAGKRILFVGKGFKGKGLDTLLDAFTLLRKTVSEARLTVVGPTQHITGENVDYLGRIADRNAVRELYFQHSVFAMPSLFEPLGQVFLEAMSCRLPCIGTTLDAMPEMILDGKTGYTIEPSDVETLAERLRQLVLDPQLARQMGEAGFARLRERFTWDTVGAAIMRQCQNLLKRD